MEPHLGAGHRQGQLRGSGPAAPRHRDLAQPSQQRHQIFGASHPRPSPAPTHRYCCTEPRPPPPPAGAPGLRERPAPERRSCPSSPHWRPPAPAGPDHHESSHPPMPLGIQRPVTAPGSSSTGTPVMTTSARIATSSLAARPATQPASGSPVTSTARSCNGSARSTFASRAGPPPCSGSSRTMAPSVPAPRSSSTCQAVTSTPEITWKQVPPGSRQRKGACPKYGATRGSTVIAARLARVVCSMRPTLVCQGHFQGSLTRRTCHDHVALGGELSPNLTSTSSGRTERLASWPIVATVDSATATIADCARSNPSATATWALSSADVCSVPAPESSQLAAQRRPPASEQPGQPPHPPQDGARMHIA